jgi:hypothetical protein
MVVNTDEIEEDKPKLGRVTVRMTMGVGIPNRTFNIENVSLCASYEENLVVHEVVEGGKIIHRFNQDNILMYEEFVPEKSN